MLVESLYCKGVLDMYYIQSHSQQRHRGGLGILIPSFLVLSFRSFKSDEVAEIAHKLVTIYLCTLIAFAAV
jgi:hypothetical protein